MVPWGVRRACTGPVVATAGIAAVAGVARSKQRACPCRTPFVDHFDTPTKLSHTKSQWLPLPLMRRRARPR